MADNLSLLIKALLDSTDINKQIKELQTFFDKSPIKIKLDINNADFKQFADSLEKINTKINKSINTNGNIDKIATTMNTTTEGYAFLEKKVKETTNAQGQLVKEVKKYKQEVNEAGEAQTVLTKKTEETIDNFKKQRQEQEKLINQLDLFKQKMLTQDGLKGEIDIFAEKQRGKYNPDALKKLKEEIDGLTINTPHLEQKIKSLGIQFGVMKQAASESGNIFSRMFENMGKFMRFYIAGGMLVGFVRSIRDSIQYVKDLDNALNQIRIVLGSSQEEVESLAKSYNKLAKEMGATTTELVRGATEWFRQGKTVEETEQLVKASIIESKLAAIDSAQATEYLTAVLNGYKIESKNVLNVIDQMVAVDNAAATSVSELSEALQRSSNSASEAGVGFSRLLGYIGTVSSVTRKSASTIGESFKTIFARMQDVKAGNIDEDGMSLSDVESALNRVNISLRLNETTFRDLESVLDNVAMKWGTLNQIEQSNIAKAIAGVRQRENFLVLMNNYQQALDLEKTAVESSGLALDRYGIYLESVEAKQKALQAAWESFYTTTLNSDVYKWWVDSLKVVVEWMDRLGGGIPLIAGLVMGVLTAAIIALNGGVKKLNLELIKTNLLTGGLPLLIGLVTTGVTALGFAIANANKEVEEGNKAYQNFNEALKDFNKNLDISKINELTAAYKELKDTLNIEDDNNLQNQIELKKSELKLAEQEVENAKQLGKYGALTVLTKTNLVNALKREISSLEQLLDAQDNLNSSQKIAQSLDYESVQTSNRKIANTLKEIGASKQLFDSYQKVYNKIKEGKELTQDEISLNNRLISDYPEYTRVLNDKTGAIGVNIEALQTNLKAQEALAIVEFNSMIETAKMRKLETEQMIEQTKSKVLAIESEIKALEARNTAYSALIDADDPNSLRYEKFYMNNANRIKDASKLMSEANASLNRLNLTKGAWETLEGLKVEDLLLGGSSSGGIITKSGEKIYQPIIDRYHQISIELERINSLLSENQALSEQAEGSEKITYLKQRVDLYEQQKKLLQELNVEQQKELALRKSELTAKGFTIDGQNNITNYASQLKKYTGDAAKDIEEIINRFVELSTRSIPDTNNEILNLGKAIKDIGRDIQTYISDVFNSYYENTFKNIEKEISMLEKAKKTAQETANAKIKALEQQITDLERVNKEEKESEERAKRLLDLNKQREKLANIQSQKNVRIFKDGEWNWVANPQQVRDETERLKEMELDYQEWERENKRQRQIQSLRDQIQAIKEALETELEGYDDSIKALQEFLADQKEIIEKDNIQKITTAEELKTALLKVDKSMYSERLKELEAFTKSYNALMGGVGISSIGAVYQDLLGRSPDAAGLEYWNSQLTSGKMSISDIEKAIKNSAEYKKKIASLDTGGYTGTWSGDSGKLAVLHQKEVVLNEGHVKGLFKLLSNPIQFQMPKFTTPNFALAGAGGQQTGKNFNFYNTKIETNDASEFFTNIEGMVRHL